MSLGLDLIEVVRLGGSENWIQLCEKNQKAKSKRENKLTKIQEDYQKNLTEILNMMGTKRWSTTQISETLNIPKDTAYHRLKCLVDRGEIKRSKMMPYVYFKP